MRHALRDPEGFVAVVAQREKATRTEQDAERAQTFLDIGGEIG